MSPSGPAPDLGEQGQYGGPGAGIPGGEMPPPPPWSWPSMPAGAAAGPLSRQGIPLAEWWQRLVAIIIDIVILDVPKLILMALVMGAAMSGGFYVTTFGVSFVVLGIVFVVVDIGYFALMNGSSSGQTLGQILLGIAVRDATTGGAVEPKRAGLRIVVLAPGLLLSWIPILAMLADLYTIVAALSPLWDPERRGFHDKIANTDVVKVR
ncbi:MAG: RDD family protein [Acidimicrobiales bacterium]